MATVLVLDVNADKFRIAECEDLDDFYRELEAKPFDIAKRKVGGKVYDIFVDDNGLLKDSPIVSAVNENMEPMLVGNLIFANHDEEGNTTSLTDEDVAIILSHSIIIVTRERPIGYTAVLCEY